MAGIQLFCEYDTPTYSVIAGKLKRLPSFLNERA
jgi:hypothetical protein